MRITTITAAAVAIAAGGATAAHADFELDPTFPDHHKHDTLEFLAEPGMWIDSLGWEVAFPDFKHDVKLTVWWEDDQAVLDSYQWRLDDSVMLEAFWYSTFTSQDLYAYKIEVEWHNHRGDVVGMHGTVVPAPGALGLLAVAGTVGGRRRRRA